jgi:hypothetical protein
VALVSFAWHKSRIADKTGQIKVAVSGKPKNGSRIIFDKNMTLQLLRFQSVEFPESTQKTSCSRVFD